MQCQCHNPLPPFECKPSFWAHLDTSQNSNIGRRRGGVEFGTSAHAPNLLVNNHLRPCRRPSSPVHRCRTPSPDLAFVPLDAAECVGRTPNELYSMQCAAMECRPNAAVLNVVCGPRPVPTTSSSTYSVYVALRASGGLSLFFSELEKHTHPTSKPKSKPHVSRRALFVTSPSMGRRLLSARPSPTNNILASHFEGEHVANDDSIASPDSRPLFLPPTVVTIQHHRGSP